MKIDLNGFSGILLILIYIAGWVLAVGFWSLLFAVIFPPYSIYLVLEKLMIIYGVL